MILLIFQVLILHDLLGMEQPPIPLPPHRKSSPCYSGPLTRYIAPPPSPSQCTPDHEESRRADADEDGAFDLEHAPSSR